MSRPNRRSLSATALFLLAAAPAARAAVVTYSTDLTAFGMTRPTFGISSPSDTGTSTLTVAGVTGFSATVPPTSVVSLGTITVSSTSATPVPLSTFVQLNVNQTTPLVGSAAFGLQFSGTVSGTNSTEFVQFLTTSVTIGGYAYTILNSDGGVPGRIDIPAPSAGGSAVILASVTAVPEPACVAATATVAGLLLRRRSHR